LNREDLIKKTEVHAISLLHTKGYISSVDVIMKLGYLSQSDYEKWRLGQVDYLERVCKCNLKKLSLINKTIRRLGLEKKLKPSGTVYNKWGKGPKRGLRFSKSGLPTIEIDYSTHYVGHKSTE
jgi:hypothetical protein